MISNSSNSSLSDSFFVSNGVCQGGVLSPLLFTVYLDDLLSTLRVQGIGCHWDSLLAGAVCYADDLALLAPSPSALHVMLRSCEQFACGHGLKFNPLKSQLIRFSRSPSSLCSAQIVFCGSRLPFSEFVFSSDCPLWI